MLILTTHKSLSLFIATRLLLLIFPFKLGQIKSFFFKTILANMTGYLVLHRFNTKNIHQFIAWQKWNFISQVIQGENNKTTKPLLFNNDSKKKHWTFYNSLQSYFRMKKLHQVHSIKTHCSERSRACSWQQDFSDCTWCRFWLLKLTNLTIDN